jgi:hypothetical protein
MSTRGKVFYYLTAWFVGCFIAAICIALGAPDADRQQWQNNFFVLYLVGLFYGSWYALALAWIFLRWMDALSWKRRWQWAVAGAVFCLAVTFPSAKMLEPAKITLENPGLSYYLWAGPGMLNRAGLWAPLVCGAATALLLHYIRQKYTLPPETAESALDEIPPQP